MPHSHVVEAEQVVAGEGPERGHCAAASLQPTQRDPALALPEVLAVAAALGWDKELLPDQRLLGNKSSVAALSGGGNQQLPECFQKVGRVTKRKKLESESQIIKASFKTTKMLHRVSQEGIPKRMAQGLFSQPLAEPGM